MRLFLFLALLCASAACSATPTITPFPPTSIPQTPTAETAPTAINATEMPAAPPTLMPALLDVTLPRLAQKKFTNGEIKTTRVLTETDEFTTSLVSYESEGLNISGLLNVPRGSEKFPAVVLVHGYVAPDQYTRGLDAQAPALELTRHGYITLVPDLRGYADSEHGLNLFLSGWIADVINAGNALKQLPNVDADHVGLWGHSMGGGIANRVMVMSDVFDAVVLYAPISANIKDMFLDPFGGEPNGVTEELIQNTIAALDDANFRADISPIHFLNQTRAPVSIHVGAADNVTPKEWSRAIRDGLQQANKQVEYFDYQGQGHSFNENALPEFYARVLDFFERNLK